jgi:hypothetical protein
MKANFMNKSIIILTAMSCSLICSCSIFKKTGKTKTTAITTADTLVQNKDPYAHANDLTAVFVEPSTPAKADPAAEMARLINEVSPLWANRLSYTSFAGKAKVNYSGPGSSRDFTANIRLKKDSVIWATITFLGIPAARVFVTQDSLFVLNYIQREVTKLPLSRSGEVLPAPIDFKSLQNLIIGEPLRDGRLTSASTSDKRWTVLVEDPAYMQRITYSKADSTISLMQIFTKDTASQASINHDRFEKMNNRRLPLVRSMRIQNGKDVYTIDLELQSATFDVAQEYPFSIPKNYTVTEGK